MVPSKKFLRKGRGKGNRLDAAHFGYSPTEERESFKEGMVCREWKGDKSCGLETLLSLQTLKNFLSDGGENLETFSKQTDKFGHSLNSPKKIMLAALFLFLKKKLACG